MVKKKAMTTPPAANPDEIEDADDLGIVMGTEADVTKDDIAILGDKNSNFDMDEDEEIFSDASASAFSGTEETMDDFDSKDLHDELNRTGDDLDVSGGELDDADEAIGEEDEENNYYSLGGDTKDSLEEDPSSAY